MSRPPLLDPAIPAGPIQPRYALLINPFYPKDPYASFGKHVLTPTLALTSFAATTAQWYRSRGSKVVLGGLHVLSCPEECAPYADSLAVGDGVQIWPRILADVESRCLRSKYVATYESDYREDPAPVRVLLPSN